MDCKRLVKRLNLPTGRAAPTDPLASRTYGELAAVTAGIPSGLTGALPRRPSARARRRIPFNTAVTGGACMAGLVNGAWSPPS